MKSIEQFYDLSFGCYCGVLVRKDLSKKIAKMIYRQTQELKELLASNLDEIEVSNWTLAYPDGKQTSFHYYSKSSNEEKIERINVLQKTLNFKPLENIFIADNSSEAEKAFMEHHENSKEAV